MSSPVWFITGTSNGMGLDLALRALEARHRVVGTVRNPDRSAENMKKVTDAGGKIIVLDLEESRESIISKAREAEAIYGHFDYVVNNAAYSLLGPLEHFSEEEIHKQYKANVFGPLWVIQALLPGLRQHKSGLIVNFSSVAGQNTNPGIGAYGSTKAALEQMSEALSLELADFNIQILIIEPGIFRTNFFGAIQTAAAGMPEHYNGTAAAKAVSHMKQMSGKQPGDPKKLVDKVFEIISGQGEAGKLKDKVLRFAIGADALQRIDTKQQKLLQDLAFSKQSEDAISTKIAE